ncbi:CHASE2 domain-containing protein [Methylococcus sp. EFPC2]|uniref:CHASE2 domain-containing protein n=1 Tax=Methylococcus sp. EFPC2 TaxID=2812648 RepID=UPI0019672CDB|nr:adenylate/guanylate cyclase domain-containing protein [Methylococcus sp. EFPC2]QSA96851.1 adenylate/guanylate cyclase domain-containing protein [Methylococcus sp. EFPC2]
MKAWSWLSSSLRRNLWGLALGLTTALLGLTPHAILLEESLGLDLLFALRGARTPPEQVATLAIDRASALDLQAPDDPGQWPRELHAEALRRLKAAGAEIAVFDIVFGEPRDAQDAVLARAMNETGISVLATLLKLKHVQGDAYAEIQESPAPTLGAAALGTGPFLLAQGPETIRFLPWHGEREDQPTLPLLAVQHYLRHAETGSARSAAQEGWSDVLSNRGPRFFDHYGPAGSIRRLSYSRLLRAEAGELPDLRGKVVVVGYAEDFQPETSLQFSPFSWVSSLELTATAIANLLENRAPRPLLGTGGQAAFLFVLGVALGVLARRARMSRCVLVVTLSVAAYTGLAGVLFGLEGLILPLILPLLWLTPLTLLGGLIGNYRRRTREHRQIHAAIRRFIPVEVASRLIHPEGRQDWDGRLCYGICLASDAGQYTALAERTEPMALGQLMNAYYARLFPLVTAHGGRVSDVQGDAMMALWIGAEDDVELHRSALSAALAMQNVIEDFEREHGIHLPLRIGLNCGPMRVGFVGAHEHGEYRAVGDTVNTAARLEALNKVLGTRVLASDWLLYACGDHPSRSLGRFLLAGKTQPVAVREVLPSAVELGTLDNGPEFAQALTLFQDELWEEAWTAFDALADRFPADGPVRFFRDAARARVLNPQAESIVRIDKPLILQHKSI